MEATLRQAYEWPNMRHTVQHHVHGCAICQRNKQQRKKYGKMPVKVAEKSTPWNRVNVDMIGPLKVKAANGTFELRALTMIDPATGWFEVQAVQSAASAPVMAAFDDIWLSRYPRPEYLGFDGGSEFKSVFEEMRKNYGMKKKQSTPYNPQSNGIIERVHQVLNDAIRTFELSKEELDKNDPFSSFLSAAAFAIRSTYHTTLGASPGQLVFGRDMILPIKFKAQWAEIRQRRQTEMKRNQMRENNKRIAHTFKVGDQVLLTDSRPNRPKLDAPRKGPFAVLQVYSNGTLRIQRGAITERVNIRRLTPFFESRGQA
jgi:hypothetical protein